MKIENCKLKVKNIILDTLFPRTCVGCGREGKYICDNCKLFISEAVPVCPVCYKPSFFGETHSKCIRKYSLNGLISMWDCEGLIRKLIYKIKHEGLTHAIDECVDNSFKLIATDINRFYSFLSFLSSKNTYISYIPMYIKKEKKRGFNQAEIIAKRIGKVSNSRVVPLIKKIIDTENHTNLDREKRLESVKASFAPDSNIEGIEKVLLVGDVFATGATMKECCEVLKQSGVERVWGFTLTRTP